MKFTSEDLLKVMGLKVGQKVLIPVYDNTEFIITKDCLKNEFCTDLSISVLVDEDFTIIQPKPTLTEDEKVILRNLDKKWKWIARDEWEDNLVLFTENPCRCTSHNKLGMWGLPMIMIEQYTEIRQYNRLFQFIKWENEPYSIEKLLKE